MADKDGLEQTRRTRGLVSGRVSGSRVHAERWPAPPDLDDVIECFWHGQWNLTGQPPHTTELLSDPSMHLVVELGDAGPACRIVGVWTDLWTRTLAGQGRVYGIKLHPGACQALTPVPAKELSNAQHTQQASDLVDALETGDTPADLLADWFRRNRHHHPTSRRATEVVSFIKDSPLTRVADVAQAHDMSVRALQRLFAMHVGASPKWVVRRFRLQEAADRVENRTAGQLADLAYSLGYADQAHLARDFRAATGKTLSGFGKAVWVE